MSSPTPHRFGFPVWDLRDLIGWVLDRDPAQFGRIHNAEDATTAVRVALLYNSKERGNSKERDPKALTTILHALQSGELSAHEGEAIVSREHWGARTETDLRSAIARGLWFYSNEVLRLWPLEAGQIERGSQECCNRNSRAPNWSVWKHIPNVEAFVAVALSLNIDPNKVRHSSTSWMAGRRMFEEDQEFKDRVFVVERNIQKIGLLNFVDVRYNDAEPLIRLDRFARWARGINWSLPPELRELSLDPVPQPVDSSDRQGSDPVPTYQDDPEPGRSDKRDAVKFWILGKYPDGIPPGTSNKEIARLFEAATAISVDERTVRRARGGR